MRRLVLLVCAVVWLPAGAAHAQDAYAAVLTEYLTGDPEAAITRVRELDGAEILAGVQAFNTTHARRVLTIAAALHTEAAFRGRPAGTFDVFHLEIATALVEFGEKGPRQPNSPISVSPLFAAPVSDDFRQLWYGLAIMMFECSARFPLADRYLDHALALYPQSFEIQLLAGVYYEMMYSPRSLGWIGGDRKGALRQADAHYRAVLAVRPDRLEARLRLGRVRQQQGDFVEARSLLTPLVSTEDNRIAYLAALFLGGIEDASQNPDAALSLYDQAAARVPVTQTARLAASELRHRKGERQAAAEAVPLAAGDANTLDPWWSYLFGEYWRDDLLLDAIRLRRRP